MGDSQRPKPIASPFEVPDLELEAVPRRRTAAAVPNARAEPGVMARENGGHAPFDDSLGSTGSVIDLDIGDRRYSEAHVGAGASFDALGDLELEGNAHSGLGLDDGAAPDALHEGSGRQASGDEVAAQWPSGQALARDRLVLDPVEISLLADYGEPPKSAYFTPQYAYRVFTRQRELKSALAPLDAQREQAEAEREAALVELARAVRPDAERLDGFRRLLAPLVELEQVASARGQALSTVNAELTARASAVDAELAALADQLVAHRAAEADAQRRHDEQDAAVRRAEAKLKRVHIEIRAVTQVAEQKLGPQGGAVPEPEATQLPVLKQRAAAIEPEVSQAKADHQRAKSTLDQASARVSAVAQSQRVTGRKRQALVSHYERELQARGSSLSESERAEHAALAELGRAVLAARGAVPVSTALLERARTTSARADALLVRCELHLRALDAFDRARAAQGVRLVGTLVGTVVFLIVLKIAL